MKSFFGILILSFLWNILGFAQSPGYVKILTHNIGSADFKLKNWYELEPTCPSFKICDPHVMKRVREHIRMHSPDVIHLQEVLDPVQLTQLGPGLLPAHYKFVCGSGASRLKEVCIAWNQNVAELQGLCHTIFTHESGVVKCTLSVRGLVIDFINVHPSAWDRNDRINILGVMWSKLVQPGRPTLIAGDFNTKIETYKASGLEPYPSNFGTVFGWSHKNYGRWPLKKSFFGHPVLDSNGELLPKFFVGSTVFREKIDHIFANFGKPNEESSNNLMPCKFTVCLGNQEGYEWGSADWSFFSSLGPKTDHLPILALIRWQ